MRLTHAKVGIPSDCSRYVSARVERHSKDTSFLPGHRADTISRSGIGLAMIYLAPIQRLRLHFWSWLVAFSGIF